MPSYIPFVDIVRAAWLAYDDSRAIESVTDISAQVSTNHVYRIRLADNTIAVGKLSYFGRHEHFVEDHEIIDTLSNNLPAPFENFLSRALMKGTRLFVYRHQDGIIDAWVVFYRPIKVRDRLPPRLTDDLIGELAVEFAQFHKACFQVRNTLPPSSKTWDTDIEHLLQILDTPAGRHEFRGYEALITEQCETFRESTARLMLEEMPKIPVFVDWNIGNFSVTPTGRFYSRWDYDWFRISSRMMDFYFIARVVSDRGDRTVFSYGIDVLSEDRFIYFLKRYHEVYPLTANELDLLQEVYRFFILNYVIKDGRYFFHEIFATKLQAEAFESYLPSVETFSADKLKAALGL